jgi:ech hydrogenase subunit D
MGLHTIQPIETKELLSETLRLKSDGYRIVAISATGLSGGATELSYSFDKNYDLVSLRFIATAEDEVSSISLIYSPAFIYENEIKELFGVNIVNITLDYNNNFYTIPVETPFKKAGEE